MRSRHRRNAAAHRRPWLGVQEGLPDPIRRRPVSRAVFGESPNHHQQQRRPRSMKATRITHRVMMAPSTLRRMQVGATAGMCRSAIPADAEGCASRPVRGDQRHHQEQARSARTATTRSSNATANSILRLEQTKSQERRARGALQGSDRQGDRRRLRRSATQLERRRRDVSAEDLLRPVPLSRLRHLRNWPLASARQYLRQRPRRHGAVDAGMFPNFPGLLMAENGAAG